MQTPGTTSPAFCSLRWVMAENQKGKGVKSTIGVLGALASIISVWWFALRPRRKHRDE